MDRAGLNRNLRMKPLRPVGNEQIANPEASMTAPRQAFDPYAPLDRLKAVTDGVFLVDGPEIRMSYLGLKLPFPTRMTILRLADGGLWVHSPTALAGPLRAAVDRLGPVRHLVAPNTLHYSWLADWHDAFPAAECWIPPGLASRVRENLPPATELGDAPPPAWADQIGQVLVPGGLLTEVDFFHRASRTLILTDLIENFEPRRVRNPLLRWIMRWSGAADPDGKAPIDMQMSFRKYRPDVRRAVVHMIEWAPKRIIIAHGRWYDQNGTAELRRAFRWVL